MTLRISQKKYKQNACFFLFGPIHKNEFFLRYKYNRNIYSQPSERVSEHEFTSPIFSLIFDQFTLPVNINHTDQSNDLLFRNRFSHLPFLFVNKVSF